MKKFIDKEVSDYFIFSYDESKPHAIYLTRKGEAKFYLNPVKLAYTHGFDKNMMEELYDIVIHYQHQLLRAFLKNRRKKR